MHSIQTHLHALAGRSIWPWKRRVVDYCLSLSLYSWRALLAVLRKIVRALQNDLMTLRGLLLNPIVLLGFNETTFFEEIDKEWLCENTFCSVTLSPSPSAIWSSEGRYKTCNICCWIGDLSHPSETLRYWQVSRQVPLTTRGNRRTILCEGAGFFSEGTRVLWIKNMSSHLVDIGGFSSAMDCRSTEITSR